jgi:hypothetical protein
MVDRPGSYNQPSDSHAGEPQSNESNFSQIDFNWTPADSRQISGSRSTAVSDRSAQPEHGVLTLQYGDPNFDQKLQSQAGAYDTLQIEGFPQGVGITSWLDNNGVFFWFKNGQDNRAHHYIPPGLKTIVVNGIRQDCDEIRLEATQAYLAEKDQQGVGFTSIDGRTDPLHFAQRLASISDDALALEERTLAQSAANSPANPYFLIYHSDIVVAEAMKPIMQQVMNGQSTIDLNNPYTMRGIDIALQDLQAAQNICRQYGNVFNPNNEMMPGLYPFALNPYYYNPDMYWGGALYQTWQREVLLSALKQWMRAAGTLELPPVMPPG